VAGARTSSREASSSGPPWLERSRPIRRSCKALLAAAGTTVVLVTHDQEEALSLADVVAVLHEGRIA
jgi:ABC-type sulfate/molybdate transport systems ATPase subunit